jgi:hypothetical protein
MYMEKHVIIEPRLWNPSDQPQIAPACHYLLFQSAGMLNNSRIHLPCHRGRRSDSFCGEPGLGTKLGIEP